MRLATVLLMSLYIFYLPPTLMEPPSDVSGTFPEAMAASTAVLVAETTVCIELASEGSFDASGEVWNVRELFCSFSMTPRPNI